MPLEQAFEWIDLEEPLGSASISQARRALCTLRALRCRWARWGGGRDAPLLSNLEPGRPSSSFCDLYKCGPKDGVQKLENGQKCRNCWKEGDCVDCLALSHPKPTLPYSLHPPHTYTLALPLPGA